MEKTLFQPLKGVRVLDLTQLLPGPYASMVLADMGAHVIKVEPPGGDYVRHFPPKLKEGNPLFYAVNRGKKSIVLNLKEEKDKEVFFSLAREAHVVLEGFRPGVLDRLGCGYDQVNQINPKVVWCSITGFGQTGPRRDFPGHDLIYIALSGVLDQLRDDKGVPIVPGVHIADISSALWAVIAILGAVINQRERGIGAYLDVSMTESSLSFLPINLMVLSTTGSDEYEYPFAGQYPSYQVYQTRDGEYIALTASEEKFWKAFCKEAGREDLIPLHLSADPALFEELKAIFASKTKDEWLEIAARNPDTMISEILTVTQVVQDPQMAERGMVKNLTHPTDGTLAMLALPFLANLCRPMAESLPPTVNQHGDEIRKRGWDSF